MNQIEHKFQNICRCCLSEDTDHLKHMLDEVLKFGPSHSQIKLTAVYTSCSGVQLNDKFSKNICPMCEHKLTAAYEFIELCQNSYRRLQSTVNVKNEECPDIHTEKLISQQLKSRKKKRVSTREEFLESAKVESLNQEDLNDINVGLSSEESGVPQVQPGSTTETLTTNTMEADYLCYHCDTMYCSFQALEKHREDYSSGQRKQIDRECQVCGNQVQGYLKHLLLNHRDYQPNSCRVCSRRFQIHAELKKHLHCHIDDGTTFRCNGCSRLYKTEQQLRHHIAVDVVHQNKSLYHCSYCGFGTYTFKDFLDHFRTDHDPKSKKTLWPCYSCKKVFMGRKCGLNHKCSLQKSKAVNMKCSVTCEHCPKMFANDDELLCHQYSTCPHTPDSNPDNKCQECSETFISKRALAQHTIKHSRLFVCDICGYQTITASKLKYHKTVHLTDRTFVCDQCPGTYKNKYSLQIHKKVHKERRYECFFCYKKFISRQNVKEHLGSHSQAMRKFSCSLCEKSFVRAPDRDKHFRSHTNERPIKCTMCNEDFRSTTNMTDHQRRVHEGLNVCYVCPFCSKKYTRKTFLAHHMFSHRGFKPFVCPACPQQFVKKYEFTKHLPSVHNIEFVEKIHGYRENECYRSILTNSKQILNENGENLLAVGQQLPILLPIDEMVF